MTETIDLPVLGMTCAACVRRVERAVAAAPGVARAEVNLLSSRARVELDPAQGSATQVAAAIRAAGYEVPADALDPVAERRLDAIERAEKEEAGSLVRDATVAIALAAPLVAIAMLWTGVASVVLQLVLGTVVVLGPGMRYTRAGLAAVRHRSPDMNTLIALGAGAAWLSSVVVAARWLAGDRTGEPHLYFEAGAAIVAFVMIGKLLESRARARVGDAVRGLMALAPDHARRLHDGGEEDVAVASLVAGDAIAVRPGERVAADGTVVEGRSAIDESLLTGEAMPVDKAEGSPVYAGTVNHHGALVVRVARAGAETALARIARAVEDAQGAKAPIARLADRVSAWFVPAVLAIAAVTFLGWWLAGAGAGTALETAIAVLVIACPCALGLATPAAVAVGTARGAELGVLFKGGGAVEIASRIDVACLDKTGTLTLGAPTLVGVVGGDDVLRAAATIEQASEHPIAHAIVAGARDRGLVLGRPIEAVVEPGAGISARIASDGGPRDRAGHGGADRDAASIEAAANRDGATSRFAGERDARSVGSPGDAGPPGTAVRFVRVGTRDYLALAGIDPAPFDNEAQRLADEGRTVSYVAIDDRVVGLVAVADPPAAGARDAVAALRGLGIEAVMVTGDREGAARWVAGEVGVAGVHAGVRPTDKARIVRGLHQAGRRVAMVGDGINDAPALAAADLGIAIGGGTDIAAATADVTLLRGAITALPIAFSLARATLRVIRRNLVAAFAYNAICIPIAAAGLLSPMFASAAMSLSSVSVLAISLRLRSWRP